MAGGGRRAIPPLLALLPLCRGGAQDTLANTPRPPGKAQRFGKTPHDTRTRGPSEHADTSTRAADHDTMAPFLAPGHGADPQDPHDPQDVLDGQDAPGMTAWLSVR
jgi:hypothetical protein